MHPLLSLIRRWAVDWLAAGDPRVCPDILAPGYSILIGGHRLDGRDAYIEGTLAQLARFPGLGVTVHDVICSERNAAVRFTEHGAAARLDFRRAAWSGIALFSWDGTRLTGCWAEEDYLGRRRQLDTGTCDVIAPPAAAPWNSAVLPEQAAAEAVVRAWLESGDLGPAHLDDGWLGHATPPLLEDVSAELDALFSAGDAVAFHGLQRGRYANGAPGSEAHAGKPAALHLAGLVRVHDGRVSAGHVVRDRLGLIRRLGTEAT